MRKIILTLALSFFAWSSTTAIANNDEFPGRKEFPKVPIYETAQLNDNFRDVVVVDTRSEYEFQTLRIKGSINIPVASKSFEQQIEKLRLKTDKSIVFYCNGRTCFKSYLAVKKASAVGVKNVFAYDAGIFEWTTAQPKKAVLLGKSPVNVSSLIASNKFKSRLLDPDTFSEKAMGSSTLVLDVRDKYQRAGVGFYPGKERWVSLDNKEQLAKHLKKAKAKNQTVYIYDEVGKQVRWLQYALEELGIEKYYFMDKGAKAYYASMATW